MKLVRVAKWQDQRRCRAVWCRLLHYRLEEEEEEKEEEEEEEEREEEEVWKSYLSLHVDMGKPKSELRTTNVLTNRYAHML